MGLKIGEYDLVCRIREDFLDDVSFQLRAESWEGISVYRGMGSCGSNVPGRGNNIFKVTEEGVNMVILKTIFELVVENRLEEDEVGSRQTNQKARIMIQTRDDGSLD